MRQVVPTADRQRATVQVKVAITDRDPRILPEMGARVDFMEPEPPAGEVKASGPARIRVPAEAVRQQDGQMIVWLVRDGRLQSRNVNAGPVSGGFREIRSGLSGGEMIVVGAADNAKAGQRVKSAQTNTPASSDAMALVEIRNVHKSFQRNTQRINVFTGITLDMEGAASRRSWVRRAPASPRC